MKTKNIIAIIVCAGIVYLAVSYVTWDLKWILNTKTPMYRLGNLLLFPLLIIFLFLTYGLIKDELND